MKLIIAAVFTYLFVSVFASPVEVTIKNAGDGISDFPERFTNNTSSGIGSRIAGGGIVNPPHAIAFQVGLFVTTNGLGTRSGGSLISNTRTLTCASCVIGSSSTNLRFGSFNYVAMDAGEIRHTITPANYRIHPSYDNPHIFNNDIAVLIHPHVTYTANIQPASIATGGNQFFGVVATMSGWGGVIGGGTSEQLRAAVGSVISNADCAAFYGTNTIFAGMICTSGQIGGIQGSICAGDFGGPLFVGNGTGRILIGVANFVSNRGCDAGSPAGFARVSHHAAWIFSHM